jgi:hypothetical protein
LGFKQKTDTNNFKDTQGKKAFETFSNALFQETGKKAGAIFQLNRLRLIRFSISTTT